MNTYGTLKTAIADWLDREDLVGQIPTFVRLGEDDIYDGLRCHHNEFTATYTEVNYTLADNPAIPVTDDLVRKLPSNFREMRLVTLNDRPLKETSMQQLQRRIVNGSDSEVRYFALFAREISFSQDIGLVADWDEGTSLVYRFYGTESLDAMPSYQTGQNPVETPPVAGAVPEDNVQVETNTTRLLQHSPNLYLAAALRHAYSYLREPEKMAEWEAKFRVSKAMVQASSTELVGSTVSIRNAYPDSLRSY